jgi:hypothetical protein
LQYQYQVVEDRALLIKKMLPEGRFVQIEYDPNPYKVRSVTTPSTLNEAASLHFSYEENFTWVNGPGNHKAAYRFDEQDRLVAIEQYLDGSLYRIHKKSWGTQGDAGNLISTSVEDANDNIFYYKHFTYDSEGEGNIIEEREYGDIAGLGATPLVIGENGLVKNQDGHIKNYSYFSGKNTHGFSQTDAKGNGVKQWYKKGTNLLLKKFIVTDPEDEGLEIQERHFYTYNEDAALIQVIVDDGKKQTLKDYDGVTERSLTYISPKQELPNVGAPEVVEQKYGAADTEFLLKRTVNQFDPQGNIISQALYDAGGNHRYTLTKGYAHLL